LLFVFCVIHFIPRKVSPEDYNMLVFIHSLRMLILCRS